MQKPMPGIVGYVVKVRRRRRGVVTVYGSLSFEHCWQCIHAGKLDNPAERKTRSEKNENKITMSIISVGDQWLSIHTNG